MATPTPKYELELWVNGVLAGDISKLAQSRRFTIPRNEAEDLSFTMSVTAFEDYCAALGVVPSAILEVYLTDIRVKRNGQYLFGVQVVDLEYIFDESGATVVIQCTGFINLFKDRYVSVVYRATEELDIAWGLIDTSQSADPTDDFGVIRGSDQYVSGILRDRTYQDQNVKDGVINLTQLSDGNFDFQFTYDRQFNTYQEIGSYRPASKLTYPYNIKSMTIPHSALNLFNYIIGLGSGFGEETLRTETADGDSRTNYGTRQKIISYNSVIEQQTLDENSYADLQLLKQILELPKVKTSGEFLDLGIVGIGDRIPIEVMSHPTMPLNGVYRIEQIDVALDENDAEEISLTLDNLGVS